jgi:hypothetical protein
LTYEAAKLVLEIADAGARAESEGDRGQHARELCGAVPARRRSGVHHVFERGGGSLQGREGRLSSRPREDRP